MNEVETRVKFADTPRDGKWYQLPNEQYIRWNFELGMWDEMIVRDGKAITSGQVLADTEVFGVEECWCESCKPNTMTDMRMILCQICGNKRCPHATNHIYECTNSNEPGQKGSSWENYKVGVEL